MRKRVGETVARFLKPYGQRLKYARLDKKLFRDPLSGFQQLRPYEVLIIDSPLFQRLRGIFQTSVTYLTYPSSVHTRFEHSINCLHLADRVLREITGREDQFKVDETAWAEVRLAAMLHDIGHCVFSHGSEFFYRHFEELTAPRFDPELANTDPPAGELVNYCIITSEPFNDLLWEPIKRTVSQSPGYSYVADIVLKRVAAMVIGASPDDQGSRRFQTDIVNGPFDVDKLDYLRRDAYFTGISLEVDVDRLLPSLRVAECENEERGNRRERRLVVDHRGIAVVEQLLFARMMLYDTVYHHHKVRAANALLQSIFDNYSKKKTWPTKSKRLNSICDLLEIDEYDFFGFKPQDRDLGKLINSLRVRALPERALVITPRAMEDGESYANWATYSNDAVKTDPVSRKKGRDFFDKVQERTLRYARQAGASGIRDEDVAIDIPELPKYGKLGDATLIQIVDEYVVRLSDLFPFQKVVSNYSEQYKYRAYVFASERYRGHVGYGAFRAFREMGIRFNDLALILAHQDKGATAYNALIRNGLQPLDWQSHFFIPPE